MRFTRSVQLSTRDRKHVLFVMPVFHSCARSILGSEAETGFINCYVSSYRYRIIPDVLCFRATVPRSQQDEERLRYTDARLFVLRISTQRYVSPTILLPSWMRGINVYSIAIIFCCIGPKKKLYISMHCRSYHCISTFKGKSRFTIYKIGNISLF
jgi:hypothetical protein